MSWDEPTQEEYEDAVIEDTVHCARCGCSYVLPEGYLFDAGSVCVECTQDEIENLIAERDRLRRDLECREATIQMAVDRLGGMVEGRPTHAGNFLQRIDELVRIADPR